VHLDRAILCANYEGDDDVIPAYRIEEATDKGIPGDSTAITYISFQFLPLAVGRFVIDAFEKNYWGYVNTKIACGPLVFNAIAAYPKVTMEIFNYPDSPLAYQCEHIDVKIKITGDSPLRGVVLVFDHPEAFVCELPNVIYLEGITLVQHLEPVWPNAEVVIPLVFRAGDPGIVFFHFFAAVVGVRCAFLLKKATITEAAHFEAKPVAKINDTSNIACHVSVHSAVNGLELLGVINRSNCFLKTVAFNRGTILSAGQKHAIVAFTADNTDETTESWRSALLGKRALALLYRVPNVSFPLQRNLSVEPRSCLYRLVLKMPGQAEVILGSKIHCSVHLPEPPSQDLVLYLEPLPFRFPDISSQPHPQPYSPCRWVGITRRALSRESDFKCEFTFVAHGGGIVELPGFKLSTQPNRNGETQVYLSQTIQIIPIK
jgi:hypothetical protein